MRKTIKMTTGVHSRTWFVMSAHGLLKGGGGGGLHLKPPKFDRNLNIYLRCHNFPPLSSVQILLIPACCLLCVF